MGELREKRQNSNRMKIDSMNSTFDKKRQQYQSAERPYVYCEFGGNKPRFTSIQDRKENVKQDARKAANLTNVNQD